MRPPHAQDGTLWSAFRNEHPNDCLEEHRAPVCSDIVHRSLGFASFSAAPASSMGNVDQILTFLSVCQKKPFVSTSVLEVCSAPFLSIIRRRVEGVS